MIVITAELVGVQSGLGYAIQLARIQLQPERVISGMVVIGLIGFSLSRLMAIFEGLVCPWARSNDG
jgi:ABC-type nitrate/sulfonate/bicarbonate transport system permease component